MRKLLTAVVAGTAGLGLALAPADMRAQDHKKVAPPTPAGAINPHWTGLVLPQQAANSQLDEKQVAIVDRVNLYFNGLTDLKGLFVQTDADKRQVKGRFYVKRPGCFRFDYSAPNRKVVVSDGDYLAIQEPDLNHEDIVELDKTPFRLLLGRNVDLMRDARLVAVQESEDLLMLALQDRKPDALGRLTLYLTKKPELDLKEWVTTDAQGLNTRVQVSDLVKTEQLDANLFKRKSPALKEFR
jgi:outer membrane lipoprotein-sorting protein